MDDSKDKKYFEENIIKSIQYKIKKINLSLINKINNK